MSGILNSAITRRWKITCFEVSERKKRTQRQRNQFPDKIKYTMHLQKLTRRCRAEIVHLFTSCLRSILFKKIYRVDKHKWISAVPLQCLTSVMNRRADPIEQQQSLYNSIICQCINLNQLQATVLGIINLLNVLTK